MTNTQTVKDFINKELKQFSNHDNVRSIPSVVDGFKESQRKVVYGVSKYGNKPEKVSRLASTIGILTEYLHGEDSLASTIVGMAQRFAGSNNLNLLEPSGQFGSILSSENSSVRYISTKKSDWFDLIIKKEDEIILEYNFKEDVRLEPNLFYPTVPMWLINGSSGIGTGHSSNILPRNYKKVISVILTIVNNKPLSDKQIRKMLMPYYEGWNGSVIEHSFGSYEFIGNLHVKGSNKIIINELPVTYSHQKYKDVLINLLDNNVIKDFDSNSTENGFLFEITVPKELTKKSHDELIKIFKLSVKKTENVTLWDANNKLKKYDDVYEALQEYVAVKLESVEKRRLLKINQMSEEIYDLNQKMLFISRWNELASKGLTSTYTQQEIISDIVKYTNITEFNAKQFIKGSLLSVAKDKINALQDDIDQLQCKVELLSNTTFSELYCSDLKLL